MIDWLKPNIKLPTNVEICVTTRSGGVSEPPYNELNLASHVADDEQSVETNRAILARELKLTAEPVWLTQVHGTNVTHLNDQPGCIPEADAAYTNRSGIVLAVMTADCLPIVLCSIDGEELGVVHAGWQGLGAGIISKAVASFSQPVAFAYIGPAIGPCHYEVDTRVWQAFPSKQAFVETRPGHWKLDLAGEAQQQLQQLGVNRIECSGICTHCDQRFYSYRRDGVTGRFATLVWKR